MKKLLLSAAILFGSLGAFAQGGLGYGLRAGVNIPKYSIGNGSTESNTGFFVTGYLDAPVSPYFSVQPGLSLQNKGGKWKPTSSSETKESVMSLDIPVNLVAKLPTGGSGNFFIGAGPYVGFGLSGKRKGEVLDGAVKGDRDINFGSDASDDLKRTDFGINFLAGYQLTNGFQINAGYGLGLTNLDPKANSTAKNRVWSVGIGFGL
ncbi:porin family protein [Sphingobacterium sp.]|uniref:porin family protein n=1 Tax=Sphingobacterium sp. TaxID=341027 RepID=UPI0028AA88D4|nr:porin family protein [Sphingobacterium sp.]